MNNEQQNAANNVNLNFPDADNNELYYPLVSNSAAIKNIYETIKKVANSRATILIQGETGTGKELIAGLIQRLSNRNTKPFVKVNCAAISETLLESELFGHEKGAFTGAHATYIGKFEQADGGTLFLDEIGDMRPLTQAKILRVLQEQTFQRLGGRQDIKTDARVLAATNKKLNDEIMRGNFREDLYYRLNTIILDIPALRDRREDIEILAEFFRRKFAQELRKKVKNFSPGVLQLLSSHYWPGNIRELKNMIERAVLIVDDDNEIQVTDLSMTGNDYFAAGGTERRIDSQSENKTDELNLHAAEKKTILRALDLSGWVQKDAAALLGISARALNYKLDQHHIEHVRWRKHRDNENEASQ